MRRSGGRRSPSGIQGQSPGRGLGYKVPQKLKLFCVYKSKIFLFSVGLMRDILAYVFDAFLATFALTVLCV